VDNNFSTNFSSSSPRFLVDQADVSHIMDLESDVESNFGNSEIGGSSLNTGSNANSTLGSLAGSPRSPRAKKVNSGNRKTVNIERDDTKQAKL
jgi:hypothetical protein